MAKTNNRVVQISAERNEDGTFTGYVIVDARVSHDNTVKKLAGDAEKAGTDRPPGGLVPYQYKFTFDSVKFDDVLPMAASDARIREQRQRGDYATAEELETAYFGKTLETPLISDGRTVADPKVRAERNISQIDDLEELEKLQAYLKARHEELKSAGK